jgi:hypothetical protein
MCYMVLDDLIGVFRRGAALVRLRTPQPQAAA